MVIDLAKGLNLHLVQPARMTQLYSNCCVETSINCDTNNVVSINWDSLNLNGTLNNSAIPLKLQNINMAHNQITGQFTYMSDTLVFAKLGSNKLNGSIPAFGPKIYSFYVADNDFSGLLPVMQRDMGIFYFHNNRLSGTMSPISSDIFLKSIHIEYNLLQGPLTPPYTDSFFAQYNLFSGQIGSIHISSNVFDIKYNALSGDFPFKNIPESLNKLRISGNQFSGTILINKPSDLLIYGNLFTNVTVMDTSALTNCDLGGNPLLEFDLSYLSMCSKDNLYAIGSTLVEPPNYTEATFVNDLFPTEELNYEITSYSPYTIATSTKLALLTRHAKFTTKATTIAVKTTYLTAKTAISKSISTSTFHVTSFSNSMLFVDPDSFLNNVLSLNAMRWFSYLKMVIDVLCIGCLLRKLIKRGYKRPITYSPGSEL